MFTLSATPKNGLCPARRCTHTPCERSPDHENTYALCAKHFNEWVSENCPELVTAASRAAATPATPSGAALATVPALPTLAAEVETERTTVVQYLDLCRKYVIDGQAAMDQSGQIAALLKHKRKAIEEKRDSILDPIKASKKAVEQLFNPVIQYYDSCEKAIKDVQSEFLLAQQRAQDAQLAALQAANAAGPTEAPAADVIVLAHGVDNVRPPETMSVTKAWTIAAVDQSKLDPSYWVVDVARIQREVRESGLEAPCVKSGAVMIERDLRMVNRG